VLIKKHFLLLIFIVLILGFFTSFLIKDLRPIPADTIVGMYHPFRDDFIKKYPRGYPFKNFLITDPVRQQYPWKKLVIEQWKKGGVPWWNPFSFSGTPLLANFQSGAFYPLNILFFIFSFNTAWTIYILSQPILSLIFTYLLLKSYKLSDWAAVLGGVSFAFSGFMTAWWEWGNIGHTALWLPLILYFIDKIIKREEKLKNSLLLLLSWLFSFFAGHLQTFFYTLVLAVAYFGYRVIKRKIEKREKLRSIKFFILTFFVFVFIASIQWIPTLKFISLSTRLTDIPKILFLPWQNLIQMIVPDFFGNPATMNYWGEWNYGEYVSYIGIIPVFLAFYFLLATNFKKRLFLKASLISSIILATKNPISQISFALKLPLISSSSPARILVITCFCLSLLAAFGFDKFFQEKKMKSVVYFLTLLGGLWIFVLFAPDLSISKRNLILPTGIFLAFSALSLLYGSFSRNKLVAGCLVVGIYLLLFFDLLRFFNKFNTWSPKEFIFPQTEIINFLQQQKKPFRILALDDRILPPNFSSVYHLETIQGYDPLFLKQYAQMIQLYETGKQEKRYSFNRQINPKNINNDLINLLNVKYVLSFDDLPGPQFEKIMQEGETKLYRNEEALPRVYFDKCNGRIEINELSEQRIKLKVESPDECLLVLAQNDYPGWRAKTNGKSVKIYTVKNVFPAVLVPKGEKIVEFYYEP